jgi:hypothetical protein
LVKAYLQSRFQLRHRRSDHCAVNIHASQHGSAGVQDTWPEIRRFSCGQVLQATCRHRWRFDLRSGPIFRDWRCARIGTRSCDRNLRRTGIGAANLGYPAPEIPATSASGLCGQHPAPIAMLHLRLRSAGGQFGRWWADDGRKGRHVCDASGRTEPCRRRSQANRYHGGKGGVWSALPLLAGFTMAIPRSVFDADSRGFRSTAPRQESREQIKEGAGRRKPGQLYRGTIQAPRTAGISI